MEPSQQNAVPVDSYQWNKLLTGSQGPQLRREEWEEKGCRCVYYIYILSFSGPPLTKTSGLKVEQQLTGGGGMGGCEERLT